MKNIEQFKIESLICLIQPVDMIQALILFHKKEGDGRDWDKCRTNEKARREASLSEKVFFVLGTYCCLNFFLSFFLVGRRQIQNGGHASEDLLTRRITT